MAHADRIPLLEAEVKRLEHELAILQRQWDRKHYLWAFGVLVVPAYFVFDALIALVVALCTPALVATQAYLLAVRRAECRQLITETKRELDFAKLGASPA